MSRTQVRRDEAPAAELRAALVAAAAVLAAIGCVAVFSASAPLDLERAVPPHFTRHALALALGIALAWGVSRLPIALWRRAALPLWGVSLLALAVTAWIGTSAGGARRWLGVPGLGFAFQPAELAKLSTVLAVAAVLAVRDGRREVSGTRFGVALGLAALPALFCIGQPDLGNAVLLCALSGILLFAAGARLTWLAGLAASGAAGIAAYSFLRPYAMRRWLGFLDPWERARTEGFQLVQSFVAFGRGGLFGVGPGNGRQQLFYLPEAHTDFILSVVAEELGLLGVLLVLGAFVALLVAGLRIALRARDRFSLLLGLGATLLLAVPAALNAAVVMGLLPTKGLTLPFLSYGRSSLLVACAALGLILAVARQAGPERRARRSRR